MKELFVPRSDVNSEEFVVVEWRVADGRTVTAGEVIANIETQKSDIEVTAEASGVLVHAAEVGDTVRFEAPLAFVLRAAADIPAAKAALAERAASTLAAGDITASAAARSLAERHGVDLGEVTATGMITSADVEAHVQLIRASNRPLGLPLSAPVGMQRLVLIGGGLGATQVLEILGSDPQRQAVAIIDDDATRWGDSSLGVPVVKSYCTPNNSNDS